MNFNCPLSGVRVIVLVAGPTAPITRNLAEPGARVDRVVPTLGDANAGKIVHGGALSSEALLVASCLSTSVPAPSKVGNGATPFGSCQVWRSMRSAAQHGLRCRSRPS